VPSRAMCDQEPTRAAPVEVVDVVGVPIEVTAVVDTNAFTSLREAAAMIQRAAAAADAEHKRRNVQFMKAVKAASGPTGMFGRSPLAELFARTEVDRGR
jgi:hypothetical protein